MITLAIIYAIGILSFGSALLYSLIGAPPSDVNFRSVRDVLALIGIILCWPVFLALFVYDAIRGERDDI